MDRINGAGTIDLGGGKRGFQDENLAVGQEGTEVTAAWLNAVQEEMAKVIEDAGLALNSADVTQLSKALSQRETRRSSWRPVLSRTLTSAPGAPATGDAYLVPTGATGIWAGQVGKIAEWLGNAWSYTQQPDGHGVCLPNGTVFIRVSGSYVQKLASDVQSGKWSYAVAAGTMNALTVSLDPAPTSYASLIGTTLRIMVAAANTGAATLNVNGLGALPITFSGGGALRPADLAPGIIEVICEGTSFSLANFAPRFVGSSLVAEGGRLLNYRTWRETGREVFSASMNPGIVVFTASYTKLKDNTRLIFESLPSLRLTTSSSTTYARARLDGNAATDILQSHYLISNNGGENYQSPQLNRFSWEGIAAGAHTIEFRLGQQQVTPGGIVKNPSTADGSGWIDGYSSTWTIYEVEN